VIAKEDLKQLQLNLIRSHSVGVGNPLSQIQVRMLQLLRINTLARGRSGISQHNLNKYIQAFNSCFTPLIPRKGTVGASGDLAPLAHLALGMIGEGMAWCRDTNSYIPAA
jgi:histidine ammonia-lyase